MTDYEEKSKVSMYAIVSSICNELSDIELNVLSLVAQLDQDPRHRLFDYDKVDLLFTENNGTKMHQETKLALMAVVDDRLAK